ncbi:MAG: DNA repair protein RecN [Victivallaceae bacterium]|nr:DNA repair protein RecN [Victivallaceae bacterium]
MLSYLKIKNLALMESAEVEFHPGFNAVTGETGAGKSILLGTVALLLGVRADKSMIRQGCDRCEIVGAIKPDAGTMPVIEKLCASLEIEPEPDGELRLRRVITRTGGRCFVNDTPVNQATLAEFGELLIDVYSPGEQYTLLNHRRQLELLDRFGRLAEPAATCREACDRLQKLRAEFAESQTGLPTPAEAELLRAMADDIAKVDPSPGEDASVNEQFTVAANRREILVEAAGLAALLADGEAAVGEQLAAAYRHMETLNRLSGGGLGELLDACARLSDQANDLADAVTRFAERTEIDEEQLAELESRLEALNRLKRRYGPQLEDVIAKRKTAERRLAASANAEAARQQFAAEEKRLAAHLAAAAGKLTEARKSAAQTFEQQVATVLTRLGLPHAVFKVTFAPCAPGPTGADCAEFMFSANLGVRPQPLGDVASSGELSRVMLAVKAVLAAADTTSVLIFDEIDVNIGGETANAVAETLAELAAARQVLCISHLAQVAARAPYHFAVRKLERDGATASIIAELDPEARAAEIARMLGGGSAAIEHARMLL